MVGDKADQAVKSQSLAIRFPCDVNAVEIEEKVIVGRVAVFGDLVFVAASLVEVEEGGIAEDTAPIGYAKTETGTIRADTFLGKAEADRLIFFVEPDLFDAADGEHAGGFGKFLGENWEFYIGTQQGEIGAVATIGSDGVGG